ncbi:MAG: carboxypeptidase regulatory-like domain-containing protein [Rhodothermia bacterium]|nr:carboxypeptidase regulatory-like domain-containing protein [Rhodothermia bacterium]
MVISTSIRRTTLRFLAFGDPNINFSMRFLVVFFMVGLFLTGCQRTQKLNKPEVGIVSVKDVLPEMPSSPQSPKPVKANKNETEKPKNVYSETAKTTDGTKYGQPEAGMALLRITVADVSGTPVRATIAFERGITYGYRLFRQVPPGVYRLEAMATGYKPKRQTITVLSGQVVNQTLFLEKEKL